MAISNNAVWEIRSTATASNANGGFWVTGASGVDYSQQNAAQYNLTGCTTVGASATVATASASADMVGNGAHLISGTNSIPGFYEIISVVVGVSITFDRACSSGNLASGVINIGGAVSLGSGDDAMLENCTAGNKIWIKNGSYAIDAAVSLTAAGGTQKPIVIEGYNTARGDKPMTTSRPSINVGAFGITLGANWELWNIIVTGTVSTQCINMGLNSKIVNCKVTNTSGTANRFGISCTTDSILINVEASSTNGGAIRNTINGNVIMVGCYFHDSPIGFSVTAATSSCSIIDCIFDNCTQGIFINVGATLSNFVRNCTFYGAETPAGTAIDIVTGTTDLRLMNNIFYGWTTAINHADVQSVGFDMNNNYYNNTTDVVNWTKGAGALALNPNFIDAPNGNFAIGTNLKAGGFPSSFPAGLSTSYVDVGAVQRKELVSTDPGEANVKTGVGYTFEDVSKTGTYTGADRWTDPGQTNVRLGTAYKANSTTNNKTGTVRVPAVGEVKTGVVYDDADSLTGTYVAAERYSDPSEANVKLGVTYKFNSTTDNKTGTLDTPTVDEIWAHPKAKLVIAKALE